MSLNESEMTWMLESILERLVTLEKQIQEKSSLQEQSRILMQELRKKEQELKERDLQIEKLQHDLAYHKSFYLRELEHGRKLLDEKWALLERENSEKIEREREHLSQRLEMEQKLWEEKLVRIQHEHAEELSRLNRQDGFWAKLMRMMTWS